MFDPDAERRLLEIFQTNVAECDGFVEACADLLVADAASVDAAACSEDDFLSVMVVALAKWVSALAQAHGPNRVELASTHAYRAQRDAGCVDLVSLAIRFEPVIAPPADALSPTPPQRVDECAVAKAIARRASARRDVDAILSERLELFEELTTETEALLGVARYDVTGYRAWLAG